MYRMARNAIDRGSRDTWTPRPHQPPGRARDPRLRDPRGYVLPAGQPDFATATKFVNALIRTGVVVNRATAPFTVGGTRYPAGSYVVKTAQAFRPHVLDMFEPQDHPDDIPFPGGAPRAPYDNAGWTLAYQMGVKFDRILDGFDGPFEKLEDLARVPAGMFPEAHADGYLVDRRQNDAFIVVNRVLRAGGDVYSLDGSTVYVAAESSLVPTLSQAAQDLGVSFRTAAARPPATATRIRPVRVGLWDCYGGSVSSGWTRWILERFEFPFEVVYPPALDAGDLASRFDVLIFPDGAIPDGNGRGLDNECTAGANAPPEYQSWRGAVTTTTTVPQLKRFVEAGGTLIAQGRSTAIGRHLGLPIGDALVEALPDGATRALPREEFYVPGSILRASVDTASPLAYGLDKEVDVFFDASPVFRIDRADTSRLRPVAWFATATPLRSGWAWGQKYLDGGVAVIDAAVGKGHVLLFGPELTFRAQSHGTFKFLFNAIYYPRP
jgi:hypothetical protein